MLYIIYWKVVGGFKEGERKMKQIIVKPKDLEAFMGIINYSKFVDYLQEKYNLDTGFWIIAEGYDKKERRK